MTTRFFTSWVRRGAAAGITEADPLTGPFSGPATFKPTLTLAKDGVAQPAFTGPEITLLGPEAVVGIESAHITRTDPAPGATGVEDNFLVIAEFARPDLPWLFTPASPGASSRLRPWLVLVVLDASTTQLQAGKLLPQITVSDANLPDPNDSWGWAHAQATVDGQEDAAAAAAALAPPLGGSAVSRLICPRRLSPDKDYLACIVPLTQAGVQAALGLPIDPGAKLEMAWKAGANADVTLPVYYSWTFSTGTSGDFKSLVQRLQGVAPDTIPGFGTRTIDMSSPWESPPQLGDGMNIELDGALWVGGADRPGTLTDEARAAFETRLTTLLNFPATLLPANSAGDPTLSAVAPPIYAGRHAGQVQVPTQPGWLRTLNLDPRRRIAAAFGTRYVQDHQEFLMARAWDQLGAVLAANKLRAQAELAAEVADRLHARHFQTLGVSELISVAAPARTRVVMGASGTLQATASTTPLPQGATTVSFTRFIRPSGPVARRAFNNTPSTLVERGLVNKLAISSPAAQLDGLGQSMLQGPVASQVTADATGRMINFAWQGVLATDKTVPTAVNTSEILTAISKGGMRQPAFGLITGLPKVIQNIPPPVAADPSALAGILLQRLLPSSNIIKRLGGRITVPPNLGAGDTASPIMACPQLTAPLALSLMKEHPTYLLPGLGHFPNDRVTLMIANPAFVEAFLAGANHEMNREMLWREYPTDQRGTPFQYFWPRPDRTPDIPPITQWPPTNELGANGPANGPDLEKMVVLLVRGEILRRFPQLIVYAAPGIINTAPGIIPPQKTLALNTSVPWTPPLFLLPLDSKTTVFAYPLSRSDVQSDISAGNAGWYFVFSEPVTGPRFNFDEPTDNLPAQWTDLDWRHVPASRGFAVAGKDLDPNVQAGLPASPSWNHDAADIARIAFARPYRVGFHADQLLAGVPNG